MGQESSIDLHEQCLVFANSLSKALNQAGRSPSRPRAYSDTAGRRRFKEQMEISAGLPNLPK